MGEREPKLTTRAAAGVRARVIREFLRGGLHIPAGLSRRETRAVLEDAEVVLARFQGLRAQLLARLDGRSP
jgi:hypothetical protein